MGSVGCWALRDQESFGAKAEDVNPAEAKAEERQSNENTEYQWAAKRSEMLGGKGSELGAASCSRASDSVVDE
jgi:hypothetical protein